MPNDTYCSRCGVIFNGGEKRTRPIKVRDRYKEEYFICGQCFDELGQNTSVSSKEVASWPTAWWDRDCKYD